jgi:triosephosphate isomerase
VAYEPVWAIGTGRRAEADQIREAHAFIRVELDRHLPGADYEVPILYGGSVTPETFPELLTIPEVAGGLVGGASLDPRKFAELVRQAG